MTHGRMDGRNGRKGRTRLFLDLSSRTFVSNPIECRGFFLSFNSHLQLVDNICLLIRACWTLEAVGMMATVISFCYLSVCIN